MWALAYAALVLALFVRLRAPGTPLPSPPVPTPGEPLRVVTLHHALFYVLLLLACPLEAAIVGGEPAGRAVGLVAFASGVACYRAGVASLGTALSPLVTPHPAGHLVTTGAYGPRPAPHVPRPAPHRGGRAGDPRMPLGVRVVVRRGNRAVRPDRIGERMRLRRPMGSIAVIASARSAWFRSCFDVAFAGPHDRVHALRVAGHSVTQGRST
jgi:hypothetical protein